MARAVSLLVSVALVALTIYWFTSARPQLTAATATPTPDATLESYYATAVVLDARLTSVTATLAVLTLTPEPR